MNTSRSSTWICLKLCSSASGTGRSRDQKFGYRRLRLRATSRWPGPSKKSSSASTDPASAPIGSETASANAPASAFGGPVTARMRTGLEEKRTGLARPRLEIPEIGEPLAKKLTNSV